MGFYREYTNRNIDLSPFGIDLTAVSKGCFCTPRNAAILGEGRSDGVHYCFIRGFGETVFAVSPKSSPGKYVHAVAHDFRDFLCLLLAVGNADALEAAFSLDRSGFESLITRPGENITLQLRALGLSPMLDPFDYLNRLQSEVDIKAIKFPAGCPSAIDDDSGRVSWQAYYGRGFAETGGRSKPCSELPIGRDFNWLSEDWRLLSLYVGTSGLMLDVLEPSDTPEYSLKATANTRELDAVRKDRMQLDGDINDLRTMCLAEHYRLKSDCGLAISRWCFPWTRRRKPILRGLMLTLSSGEEHTEIALM